MYQKSNIFKYIYIFYTFLLIPPLPCLFRIKNDIFTKCFFKRMLTYFTPTTWLIFLKQALPATAIKKARY